MNPLRRIFRNKSLLVGGLITALIVVLAVFAPLVQRFDPMEMDMSNRFANPSLLHWLGTDNFGRDLWARMVHGARVSLSVGVIAVGVSASLGSCIGLLAGYYGGIFDLLIMRVVDLVLGFPVMILALALVAALGPGVSSVIVGLILVTWGQYARVVRSLTLSARELSYVEAARSIGASDLRILWQHVFRNTWPSIMVLATLGMGTAIVTESALSFLGLGPQPPTVTWGWSLAFGLRNLRAHPSMSTVAGAVIMLTVLGFNLLGDGLRHQVDPKRRERF